MNSTIWLFFLIMSLLMWTATDLLYKTGVRDETEVGTCLKYSICIGFVFFFIAVVYLVLRDQPFTIWESAVKYWPMTLFGIVYPIINTISFKGFIYNEASVESPVEQVSSGVSTILIVIAYLALGRVNSISEILTPLKAAGIVLIVINIILLATVRNRAFRNNAPFEDAKWMKRGLGTLIFPLLFALVDALESVASGVCLDST